MSTVRKSAIVYLLFLLIGFGITITPSCRKICNDTCGCDDDAANYNPQTCAQLNSIDAYARTNTESAYAQTNDVIKADRLVLEVVLSTEATNCSRTKIYSSPFINTAYACTPVPPYLYFKGNVLGVEIVADRDFDDTHKAGDNLMDLFTHLHDQDLNEAGNRTETGEYKHEFKLDKKPAMSGTYQFTIRYKMSNDQVHESVTVPVQLVL